MGRVKKNFWTCSKISSSWKLNFNESSKNAFSLILNILMYQLASRQEWRSQKKQGRDDDEYLILCSRELSTIRCKNICRQFNFLFNNVKTIFVKTNGSLNNQWKFFVWTGDTWRHAGVEKRKPTVKQRWNI